MAQHRPQPERVSINVTPEVRDSLKETASVAAKHLGIPRLSIADFITVAHKHYKETVLS